jgi:DNA-binding CsgD family transcriptional regulator
MLATEEPILTDRQREILYLISYGHTAAEVGEILSIKESTVRTTLKAIRWKLDTPTTWQAVVVAFQQGIII